MPDLVTSKELAGFPGAPFPESVVRSAGEAVRVMCGWHIAPVVTDKVRTVAGLRGVVVPTLRLVGVVSVTTPDGADVPVEWAYPSGVIVLGRDVVGPVVVEYEHGYESCPPSLLSVVAGRALTEQRQLIKQEALGARSVQYGSVSEASALMDPVLAKFVLEARP